MTTLSTLLEKLKDTAVPPLLEERILKRLLAENTRALERMLFLSGFSLVASGVVLLYSLYLFGKALLTSEFWTLFSLLFSDLEVVLGYAGDYSFSLLETFPALSLAAVLLPVFTLLISLGWFFKLKDYKGRYHFA